MSFDGDGSIVARLVALSPRTYRGIFLRQVIGRRALKYAWLYGDSYNISNRDDFAIDDSDVFSSVLQDLHKGLQVDFSLLKRERQADEYFYDGVVEDPMTIVNHPMYHKMSPYVFRTSVVDVLKQFDVGDMQDCEVKFHHPLGYFDRPYSYVNVTCRKEALMPDASPGLLRGGSKSRPLYSIYMRTIADDAVTLSAAASKGPDIWHDPAMISGFFFSDRVKTAFDQTGLSEHMPLYRCVIQEVAG